MAQPIVHGVGILADIEKEFDSEGLDANFSVLCYCVITAALVSFLSIFLWISAYQKAQKIDHVIGGMIASSIELYYASVAFNGPKADHIAPHPGHEAHDDDSASNSSQISPHRALIQTQKRFRKNWRQLQALFDNDEALAAARLPDSLVYLADLLGLSTVPSDVRELWTLEGSNLTVGGLLAEQDQVCNEICTAPVLAPGEGDLLVSRLRHLTIDDLLPQLSKIQRVSAAWQDRRMEAAKLLLLVTFVLFMCSVMIARIRLIKPLTRKVAFAASQLKSHNQQLEERVAARTAELSLALDRAKAAARSKENFLANMSHEIRTPMNGVLGVAALLQHSELEPKQQTLVQTIISSGGSLMRILDDVLEKASIASGKVRIETRTGLVKEVIEDAVALHTPSAAAKGLDIASDTADAANLPVMLDPDRLQQVLGNLIGNAVKFSSSGQIGVSLREVAKQDHVYAEIAVQDQGPGVSEADQLRIFDSFERAANSADAGGTGLGLAISSSLVEAMGGRIELHSVEGEGSRFTVFLPLQIASSGFGPGSETVAA